NLNNELAGFSDKLTAESAARLHGAAITARTLAELRIGHNGRYLVYPYVQPDGNCYAARCVHPERPEDFFWYGDERFFAPEYRVFNAPEIDRCENGTLFVVEGEENLLCLKQLGLPGIAVPAAADLEHLDPRRFEWIQTLFLWVGHNAESAALARVFATRAGFKVRIVRWPENAPKSASLHSLATEQPEGFQQRVFAMIREARAFSPFPSPAGEFHTFTERLAQEAGAGWAGLTTGFARLDRALGGLHGLNILGGTPKAGKSTFAIQAAADMAGRRLPVIYYDFENGRQKIYLRILSRLSRLPVEQIRAGNLAGDEATRLTQGLHTLETLLPWLRVVNDRKLSPETMRRHIDFLRHETRSDYAVVVIDSLHKLPFKDISQKRSGIDGWLRQLEAIRDELAVSFLVISELERGPDGQFDRQPQLGSFKGSGDIGYSADNALVLLPQWDPFGDDPPGERANDLWVVASREHSPGLVGAYRVDYPFWGFSEE
ncbi:MAG: AAA family ATPase, partial [Desulfobulbaceae bacterium]|nr:AAA family ATPase [Desulfobulbaceae bacterium]